MQSAGFNSDMAAAVRGKRAASQLADLGIKPPAKVQAALDRLKALEDRAPVTPNPNVLIDATAAGDQAAIDAAALTEATFEHRRNAHSQAVLRAGVAVSAALLDCRTEIARKLTAVGREHVEKAAAAAELAHTTVAALVQRGDFDRAAVLAAGPAHEAALAKLQGWAVNHLDRPLDLPEPTAAAAR